MENKEKCSHENISYGRINEHFILSCGKCSHIFRVDDIKTQKIILDEFKLSCRCGKEYIFEQKNKETCKWSYFVGGKIDGHDVECTPNPPPRCTNRLGGMKYCPYCGKEIEEIKE